MPYTSLSQIPAAQLPSGFTDPRGFDVRSGADGARVGTVADLLVDFDGGAHQFDIDLAGPASQHVLFPFDRASVDATRRVVQLPGVTRDDAARLPAYGAAAAGASGTAAASTAVPATSAANASAANASAADRSIDRDAVRLTLAEEQLALGTRAVQAGEIGVRKSVVTEHVRRMVPVAREEVTVERRPAVGMDAATAQVEVTDDEIRIPIFAEEVVIEKRLVPAEEYIVRKRQVTETQTVEADLRRERLAVDRTEAEGVDASATARGALGATPEAGRPGSGTR